MSTTVDLRPLAGLAVAVTVLAATEVVPVWPGTPHQVALPPLDLFADVRVLVAEAGSYPAFVAGLLGSVVVRAVVVAAVLGRLDRRGVLRALAFYALAAPFAIAAGGLAYAGVTAVYSPFLWTGAAVALLAALALGPWPWRRCGGPAALGRVAAYLAALLVVSLASTLGDDGVRVALVPVSATLTGATVRWLRRPSPRPGSRPRPLAAAAAALALVGLPPATGVRPATQPARPGTLFVVPGVGGASGTSTMFELDPAALGFGCDATAYFSYAGPGDGAPQRDAVCPIRGGAPYVAEDTRRPLAELMASFRAQYAELEPPVVVIAHSQGGWVAAAALEGASPEPAAVVLLGAFPGHRDGYRLDGTGAGIVGSDALELLTGGLRRLDRTSFHPRAPLARELLGTDDAIPGVLRRGLADGAGTVVVTSAYDLPVMAGDDDPLPAAVELCPAWVPHGSLPTSAGVLGAVRRVLDGEDAGGCGWWRRWPAQAFAAFGIP